MKLLVVVAILIFNLACSASYSIFLLEARQQTKFLLYTTENPECPQVLTLDNVNSLRNSNFNSNLPTRIVIHGWNSNTSSPVCQMVRNAYLQKGSFNVITVDWGFSSLNTFYPLSRDYTKPVGKIIAEFLDFLHEFGHMEFSSLYLIGFSLGAHIAGYAGKFVLNGRISTIFGLDPAGPMFDANNLEETLCSSDADYVEVIHTNSIFFGISQNIGTTDFYANYGIVQPGCDNLDIGCSHFRSVEIFSESINSKIGFFASECNNYQEIIEGNQCTGNGQMIHYVGGEPSRPRKSQIYYFKTGSKYPFAVVR